MEVGSITARVKTLEEGKTLLAEYEALPDGLDARLNWSGYDRLPDYKFTCVCGYSKIYPMGIDDLKQTIEKGWEWKLEHHLEFNGKCCGHDDEGEEEENVEEEE